MFWIPVTDERTFARRYSSSKVKRKEELYEILKEEIGEDLPKIKECTNGERLAIDVCYYLVESSESGKSKKDLDNLLKILDVLSTNMKNGQDSSPGLGLVWDDAFVYKIKCEKKETVEGGEGFDLKILRQRDLKII